MTKQLMAVDGDVDMAGAIVYWSLSGAVDFDALEQAWDGAELGGDLPEPPCAQTACLRAVNEERSRAGRRMRRPLEGHGHALVDEKAKDRDLEYAVKARAEVDLLGRIKVDTDDVAMRERIEAAYRRHLMGELSTTDVSQWLVGTLLPRVDAVALRSTGGFYFIPRGNVAKWREFVDVVKDVSGHTFWEIPAMHTEEAIDAILDSVAQEAGTFADSMWDDIAKGKLGERALARRAEMAEIVRKKVSRYEQLLGLAMTDLQAKLGQLQANLAAAALSAGAGEPYSDLASGFADLATL